MLRNDNEMLIIYNNWNYLNSVQVTRFTLSVLKINVIVAFATITQFIGAENIMS